LNPIAHIDPIGTLLMPAILILATGSAFGYAKPVPVNPRRMRSPRNHNVLVALGGPAVNIALAVLAALVLHAIGPSTLGAVGALLGRGFFVDLGSAGFSMPARLVFEFGVVNVILAAFNLIPLPPLDGSAVIERLLPTRYWPQYLKVRQYSMGVLLLIVFLVPQGLSRVFSPALKLWSTLL
jgi:Zn-dependent protease